MARNSLIKKFAKESGIDEDIANEVVISFFTYMKSSMRSMALPNIRLKGLGLFTPSKAKLRHVLKKLQGKEGDYYSKRRTIIKEYLDETE